MSLAFHHLELPLISYPRALDRTEEAWCPIFCCCCRGNAWAPQGLLQHALPSAVLLARQGSCWGCSQSYNTRGQWSDVLPGSCVGSQMIHRYGDVLAVFMHKTVLYIHVYVIGVLRYFFFLCNLLWIVHVHQRKKGWEGEEAGEEERCPIHKACEALIILTFTVSVFHSRLILFLEFFGQLKIGWCVASHI